MRRTIILGLIGLLCFALLLPAPGASERQLVIRLAKEDQKATVAVEAYLTGNVLEVKISASMERLRPDIDNIKLTGPGLGTLVPAAREELYASAEEEEPYETVARGGIVSFSDKKKMKKLEGGITRKLATFIIPRDKIVQGGDYQLSVRIASVKQVMGARGKATRFNFSLEKLPELLSE